MCVRVHVCVCVWCSNSAQEPVWDLAELAVSSSDGCSCCAAASPLAVAGRPAAQLGPPQQECATCRKEGQALPGKEAAGARGNFSFSPAKEVILQPSKCYFVEGKAWPESQKT